MEESDDKLGKDSPKDMAIQELEQIKTVDNPRTKEGKLRLASKKERKANIGRSPDISDMIMMRSFFDIQPKTDISMSGMSYDDL